jgi:hypothetical protein
LCAFCRGSLLIGSASSSALLCFFCRITTYSILLIPLLLCIGLDWVCTLFTFEVSYVAVVRGILMGFPLQLCS